MANDVLERISELVEPSLRQCGVDLYEAQWDARGAEPVLRLLIEKSGGVSLDDCERVSHAVSAVLDAHDPIEGGTAYHLEVSSPGAERPLRRPRDWESALGMRVNVRFRSGETTTVVEGRLVAVGDQSVEVEVREGRALRPVTIPVADIAGARRAVDI
jgi:ribosome maturation factor RimP